MTSLTEKTYSVCCYYDRSNLEVQVNAKNKKVSRDFSSRYKLNESKGSNANRIMQL